MLNIKIYQVNLDRDKENIAFGDIEESHDFISDNQSVFSVRSKKFANYTLVYGKIIIFPNSNMVTIDQMDEVFLNVHIGYLPMR